MRLHVALSSLDFGTYSQGPLHGRELGVVASSVNLFKSERFRHVPDISQPMSIAGQHLVNSAIALNHRVRDKPP